MVLILALLALTLLSALLLLAAHFVTVVPDARPALSRIQDLLALASALTALIAAGAAMLYRRRPRAYLFRARWISVLVTLVVVITIVLATTSIGFGRP